MSHCDHRRVGACLRDLRLDLERYPRGSRGPLSTLGLLSTAQLQITLLHRLSHLLALRGWTRAAQFVATLNLVLNKAALSPASCIGGGLYLACPVGLLFHGSAGAGLTLYTRSACYGGDGAALVGGIDDAPRLGSRVAIATGGIVCGRVTVGDGVRVGFGVVLRKDAPDGVVVTSRGMLYRTSPRTDAPADAQAPA